ncbi:glycosyltransferase family 61 protein [Cryomorpha ignava]|uniref:Glycosyltransferase family 61 protein n=1 Tax=Cryomorpha ignava TaxID=101383 RepID=A0A7K3WP47_9FLAO|nr:glycosyltransferase family 61 protein [Cryomorpha ignava]NEN23420.1 glycosyltransferase family 61 protein [Cryomorpha ignava]
MKNFKLIENYTVARVKPVNYNSEDLNLFQHEFLKSFKKVDGYKIKHAWIDSGGIIANFFMAIYRSSLVNLRVSKPFPFLLNHFPRMVLKLPQLKRKKYIWISERWSHGYFHWICDALPRYFILNEQLSDHIILLPSHYSKYKYVTESLEFLGLEYEYIPKGNKFLTSEILFSEPVCSTGNFYPPIMDKIRNAIHSKSQLKNGGKRVYISRKFAKVRRINNENDCITILEKFNFETIYLENLTFADQMKLMAAADVIIGVHGAGLTNMIAAPEHCSVVEIRGECDDKNNCFYSLANALNLSYYYLLAVENPTESDRVGDVDLSPVKLFEFLNKYFPV